MSEVARRVLAFVRRRSLLGAGDAVLVGTGGGAASLGLLALLAAHRDALGLARLAAASVEPDLDEWGDAAERVADVGRAVRALGVDFYAVRPADQRGAAVAVEAELRSLAEAHGFTRVVLGHTRDDDALGLLAAALSAGHLDALRPLRARSAGGVVRPLLGVGGAEAASLAVLLGVELPPLDGPPPPAAGLRGALSATVVPRLRAVAPGFETALVALAREAAEARRFVRHEAKARVAAALRGDGRWVLDAAPLRASRLLARAVAREILRSRGDAEGASVPDARAVRRLGAALRSATARTPRVVEGAIATYGSGQVSVTLRPGAARRRG